jgi:hypothetical protein
MMAKLVGFKQQLIGKKLNSIAEKCIRGWKVRGVWARNQTGKRESLTLKKL